MASVGRALASLVPGSRAGSSGEGNLRLAVATLLVRAVAVDGRVSPGEDRALRRILSREYDLSRRETARLIAVARVSAAESNLFGSTRALRMHLSEEARLRMVEILWEVAYADGEAHEFEDDMIWRVGELLGVTVAERVLLRKVVQARLAQG